MATSQLYADGVILIRIIPVIDLQNGLVVHGVAGRRDAYRPIQSVLVNSALPDDVANAIRTHLEPREVYIADLDAIAGAALQIEQLAEISNHLPVMWLDAGCGNCDAYYRAAQQITAGAMGGISRTVIGLETLESESELARLIGAVSAKELVFSLDLKSNAVVTRQGWKGSSDPLSLAKTAVDLGCQAVIVLDLHAVGGGAGPVNFRLLESIRDYAPDLDLVTGGGVRDAQDIVALEGCGCTGVLVASAIHDGSLLKDIEQFKDAGLND